MGDERIDGITGTDEPSEALGAAGGRLDPPGPDDTGRDGPADQAESGPPDGQAGQDGVPMDQPASW